MVKMVLMTMIGRVIDGLPLAASMQSDQDVSVNVDVQVHIQLIPANSICLCLILLAKRDKYDVTQMISCSVYFSLFKPISYRCESVRLCG